MRINLDGPPTPAASHGVSTLRLSSLYLQYDSNGTFRNVPLLLSHACPCAVRFGAYIQNKIITEEDAVKMFDITFAELHTWVEFHKWFIE